MEEEKRKDYPQILEIIKDLKTDVKEIKRCINGNGKIGLFSKVEIMWRVGCVAVVTIIGIVMKMILG